MLIFYPRLKTINSQKTYLLLDSSTVYMDSIMFFSVFFLLIYITFQKIFIKNPSYFLIQSAFILLPMFYPSSSTSVFSFCLSITLENMQRNTVFVSIQFGENPLKNHIFQYFRLFETKLEKFIGYYTMKFTYFDSNPIYTEVA